MIPTTIPSLFPSYLPSVDPSAVPSIHPSLYPSPTPSMIPSIDPSLGPSATPSTYPSNQPTPIPSMVPTLYPSLKPSIDPSAVPSKRPSVYPTLIPSMIPSEYPSMDPSLGPSATPSIYPSNQPTPIPSMVPTLYPSLKPSIDPSAVPSIRPSVYPTPIPSMIPSEYPSMDPSLGPSAIPSTYPSNQPTLIPSMVPTLYPSLTSSVDPSAVPSIRPSVYPTLIPSMIPSEYPSTHPNVDPSATPSIYPSNQPTLIPSMVPTLYPSLTPSIHSSTTPTTYPSVNPTLIPSIIPSVNPRTGPSLGPSATPSIYPSDQPTFIPSMVPTLYPSLKPSLSPSTLIIPSSYPSLEPSSGPSATPSEHHSRSIETTFFVIEMSSMRRIRRQLLDADLISDESLHVLATETQLFLNDNTPRTIISVFAIVFDSSSDSTVAISFEVAALAEDSSIEPLYTTVTSSISDETDEFTSLVRNSDPVFADVMSTVLDSTASFGPSLQPSTKPTSLPSHSPTVSYKPSTKPTRLPTMSPTDNPSLMPSSFPSQAPSLTPPVSETYPVLYSRPSNHTESNFTAIEMLLEEDDALLHERFVNEYNATVCTILDCRRLKRRSRVDDEVQPFIVENVHSRIIEEDTAVVSSSSCNTGMNNTLCYRIETNVNVTRYPVQFSTNRSELIVLSTVLNYMEEREIQITPHAEQVPVLVTTTISITFGGVDADVMTAGELEEFRITMFEFLDDYLGMLEPPVLLTDLIVDSQSLAVNATTSVTSISNSIERQLEEAYQDGDATSSNMTTINELTVNVVVIGEYLPPPEIEFDNVVVEVLDNEDTQEDFIDAIDKSNNSYFEPVIDNVQIVSVKTFDENSESSRNSEDKFVEIVIGVTSAVLLSLLVALLYRWNVRRIRTRVRYRINRERHLLLEEYELRRAE